MADYSQQVADLYKGLGHEGDPQGLQYWTQQLANGTPYDQVAQNFHNSADTVYQNYTNNPQAYDAQNPGMSAYFKNDPGLASVKPQPKTPTGTNLFNFGTNGSGIPDYASLAQQQYQLNQQNAQQQMWMNNPNQYGPGGSQVRTQNPDGTYSLTTSLSPKLQENYDSQNALQGNILGQANNLVGNKLDYSGVQAAPSADANDLAQTRDSLYQQQTQYLDPQFQQGQSNLESKLANQGIMPGSEAYTREMGNFNLQKQKAYGDARNSAIQAGGQEQSRLFGLGMQGRQQGVSEANTLHNSPLNDLASLRTGSQISLPNYSQGVGTSIPGVDILNAANMGFNANLGLSNANSASNSNTMNGLFGLGAAALQNPGAVSSAWNWVTG